MIQVKPIYSRQEPDRLGRCGNYHNPQLPGLFWVALPSVENMLLPDQTALIDVVLKRIFHRGVFDLPRCDNNPPDSHDIRQRPFGKMINL